MNKAHRFFVLEKFNKAKRFYDKVLDDEDLEDEHEECLFGRGKTHFQLEELELAKADFMSLTEKDGCSFQSLAQSHLEKIDAVQNPPEPELIILEDAKPAAVEAPEEAPEVEELIELPPEIPPEQLVTTIPFRDKWLDKNASKALFTIYAKNQAAGNINVYFASDKITVDVVVDEEKTYRRECLLDAEIDPAQSTWTLTRYKVVVELTKKNPVAWYQFEKTTEHTKKQAAKNDPWSNRSKKFDDLIETLEKEETKEDDTTDDSNPMGGLMNMMKKLYDEGDDDMKKMIGKSMLDARSGKKSGLDAENKI